MFSDNLNRFMKERGVSMNKLADMCGISQSAVSLYSHGKGFPNLGTVYLLAHYLEVRPEDLIADNHERPWIFLDGDKISCPVCKEVMTRKFDELWKYCPNCGAKNKNTRTINKGVKE